VTYAADAAELAQGLLTDSEPATEATGYTPGVAAAPDGARPASTGAVTVAGPPQTPRSPGSAVPGTPAARGPGVEPGSRASGARGTVARAAAARHAADRAVELGDPARQVWEALPVRAAATLESVARAAGVSERAALAGLGMLEEHGLAAPDGGRWRRERPDREP
jgi:hypothetical protein